MAMKQINIKISDSDLSRIKDKCYNDRLTLSTVIRTLMKEYADGKIEMRLRTERKEG